jgi:hypothetical protein
MGFEVIHNQNLPGPELRHHDLVQKGQKNLAIGEAFHGHRCDNPCEAQGAEQGEMPAPIHRLSSICPLASGRPGVEAGHRLMTTSFIEKDEGLRGEPLDGILEGRPLLLHLGSFLLGGVKGFFSGGDPVGVKPD